MQVENYSRETELRRELLRRERERRLAKADPLYLVSQMVGVDQRTGEKFDFRHLGEPIPDDLLDFDGSIVRSNAPTWAWQRYLAEQLLTERRLILLKGRQIGVTWVCLAVDVAEAILMPDTASLLYRQKEEEAIDNVRRWFRLYQSLPKHFTSHIRVLKPDLNKTAQPGRDGVAIQFPGGEISEIVPMTSAGSSGHGRSVRRILGDEAAYIELLTEIMAAIEPAAGPAHISLVSTANGRHNPETGEGNEFSRRWEGAEKGTSGYKPIFFPYDIHPERDEAWYATAPEVQSLKPHQRHAQFPRNPHEAFTLTSRTYFDAEHLQYYAENIIRPIYKFDFQRVTPSKARVSKGGGPISVFEEPIEGHEYALSIDASTGRGTDYSAGHVIDLGTMQICAEYHEKADPDLVAFKMHYLGRWFNTAKIAPDIQGGYGEAIVIPLRDGREGRPPYPNLYIHIQGSSTKGNAARRWGFPVDTKTRPLILSQFEKAVRERTIPGVTDALLWEMESFVYHESGPSPRALEGSNDDLVLSMSIVLEMYRQFGKHPHDHRRSRRRVIRRKKPMYPWQEENAR